MRLWISNTIAHSTMMHILNSSTQLTIILCVFTLVFCKLSNKQASYFSCGVGLLLFIALQSFNFKYLFLSDIFFRIPFSENQLLREYFSWKTPNFQDSLVAQISVVLFFVFNYYSKINDRFLKFFFIISFVLFFFYQPGAIFLNIALAVMATSLFEQKVFPLLRGSGLLSYLLLLALLGLSFALKLQYRVSKPPQVPTAIDEALQENKSEGDICLFYNLNLETYFNLSFANCVLLNHEYRDYEQAFSEYKKIITFEDGWREEVEKQHLNYLLAFIDEPVVGMFRDVLHWEVVRELEGFSYKERGVYRPSKLVLLRKNTLK